MGQTVPAAATGRVGQAYRSRRRCPLAGPCPVTDLFPFPADSSAGLRRGRQPPPPAGGRPAAACGRDRGLAAAAARGPKGGLARGTARHDDPRVQQRPDHDPQLRQTWAAASRRPHPRQGPGADPLCGHQSGEDHRQRARNVAFVDDPGRADQPRTAYRGRARPAGAGDVEVSGSGGAGIRPGAEGFGESKPDPAGADESARQRPAGDARRRPPDPATLTGSAARHGRPDRSRHRLRDDARGDAADVRAPLLHQVGS